MSNSSGGRNNSCGSNPPTKQRYRSSSGKNGPQIKLANYKNLNYNLPKNSIVVQPKTSTYASMNTQLMVEENSYSTVNKTSVTPATTMSRDGTSQQAKKFTFSVVSASQKIKSKDKSGNQNASSSVS